MNVLNHWKPAEHVVGGKYTDAIGGADAVPAIGEEPALDADGRFCTFAGAQRCVATNIATREAYTVMGVVRVDAGSPWNGTVYSDRNRNDQAGYDLTTIKGTNDAVVRYVSAGGAGYGGSVFVLPVDTYRYVTAGVVTDGQRTYLVANGAVRGILTHGGAVWAGIINLTGMQNTVRDVQIGWIKRGDGGTSAPMVGGVGEILRVGAALSEYAIWRQHERWRASRYPELPVAPMPSKRAGMGV